MEKPSSSLHQKGRRSLVHCTSQTKLSPKHSCLPMAVPSGLVSTRPFTFLADMSIAHFHIGWCGSPCPCWFLFQGNSGNLPVGKSNYAKVIHIMEECFCNHGTPEALHTDNGPQYASATFADYSIE